MSRTAALFAVCFTAGTLGALANSLLFWFFASFGAMELAGVALAPKFTLDWLYPRLVWGGLWGLVFFLAVGHPRGRKNWVRKGLWISLLPTAFQLFYIFPERTPHGLFGFGLGELTPAFVLLLNFIWGLFTGLSARLSWGRG